MTETGAAPLLKTLHERTLKMGQRMQSLLDQGHIDVKGEVQSLLTESDNILYQIGIVQGLVAETRDNLQKLRDAIP